MPTYTDIADMSTLSTYESTVNSFYLAFYGRPADPAGLKFWASQLAANNGDLAAITTAFATSAETQARFGSDNPAERIAEIYQQLFNHKPDAAGLAYWSDVVEQGHASLAEVSIAILKGSQGSDQSLVVMRQKAVDAFTAQVEASGTQYDGYASIEAARVLVRAVTAGATEADLDVLVKAAVSFADTATKTPKVVEAIATGSTLLNLFDTARGTSDPVSLAQALADTAKAAAGDPITLQSLLRDGGMNQVLKVMPAAATLKDVVEALAKGGLPAAVEVVYPSAPVVVPNPVVSASLSFKSVTEDVLDLNKGDNVTNKSVADVTFKFESKNLSGTPSFKYSIDEGKTWSDAKADSTSGLVTIGHLELNHGMQLKSPYSSTINLIENLPVLGTTTDIVLQAFDSSGKKIAETTKKIVYDGNVATPDIELAADTAGTEVGTDHDWVTNNPAFRPVNIEAGAKVEYAAYTGSSNSNGANVSTNPERVWSLDKPVIKEGMNQFYVRQTDVAGNVSEKLVGFELDTTPPASQATLTLLNDTGSIKDDFVTSDGTITVSGLDTKGSNGWEYSINGGKWIYGGLNGQMGLGTIDLGKESGTFNIQVRQHDAAGNVGTPSETLKVTLDTIKPLNGIKFSNIEGGAVGVVKTDKSVVDLHFAGAAKADGVVEWRTKDGEWAAVEKIGSDGSFSIDGIDLSLHDETIEFRVVDLAGNASEVGSVTIDSSVNNPPPPPTAIVALGVNMDYNEASLTLFTDIAPIYAFNGQGSEDGVANKATLSLEIARTGKAPGIDYFDGDQFGLTGAARLKLDATPALDFYQLKWEGDTFKSYHGDSGWGNVVKGSAYFVGGQADAVMVKGFEVPTNYLQQINGNINASNGAINSAYIDAGKVASGHVRIETGKGMDLIVDNDSVDLTIVYNRIDSTSQDVILGFDTGHDVIELGGAIAAQVDDGDHELFWATATGPKFKVQSGVEAVQISFDGQFSTDISGAGGVNNLATLNAALDLTGMGSNRELLILANNGDSSVLMVYVESNGNDTIDAGEYNIIAVSDQGLINQSDIQLVGFVGIPGG